MTTRKFYTFFASLCLCLWGLNATAQDEAMGSSYTYTPEHMWEGGIGIGHSFLNGDFDYKPGFGVNLHIRRALDYIFSIRGELTYQSFNGEVEAPRLGVTEYSSNSIGGSLAAVITLNNFRWDRSTDQKKWGPYVYGGAGAGSVGGEGTLTDGSTRSVLSTREDRGVLPYAIGGAGLSYKISPKVNIGLDHQMNIPFGREADNLDSYENQDNNRTTYRDILHYTSLRLCFNLGDASKKSQPLYWINPLEGVAKNLEDLNARPVFDLTDTDGDGVIDMVDQEKDTPADAAVDTRGIALDSDGDGVKDYEDQEPYSQPGYSVDGKGVAQVPTYTTKDAVDAAIDQALKNYQPISNNSNSIADWFLPMIHFNNDSYSIRYSDYDNLSSVATVLKNNPSIRILVKGFTDKVAADNYNTTLSYNRAKSAIEHLVQNYGISRDRVVLHYGGEANNLVPQSGSSLMNRRVEFSVARNGETNMPQPAGKAGKGTFGGSRNAGY